MMRLLTIFLCSLVCASAQLPPEMFLLSVPKVAAAATPASSLVTNLVAYWRMDETSGVRYDSVGTNHLSDSNTVGYTTGLITNCSLFVSNNLEYLIIANNSVLEVSNSSWSVSGWFFMATTNINQGMIHKADAGKTAEWICALQSTHTFRVDYYTNTISGQNTWASTTLSFGPTNNFLFFCASCDVGTGRLTLFVSMRDGSISQWVTNKFTTAIIVTNSFNSPLVIGRSTGYKYVDGRMDEVAYWKRSLSSNEMIALFIAGTNNVSYPFTGY